MGFSKSSSKREIYSDRILPQETREALTRQPNSASKAAGKKWKKNNKKQNQQKERNKSRNKWKRNEGNNS